MDMEIILKGQLFHKGRLKVSVSKMFTLNAATGGEPQPVSASHLVEVSCVVSATQVSTHTLTKSYTPFRLLLTGFTCAVKRRPKRWPRM